MLQDLHILFQRDLARLVNEISLYKKESQLWLPVPGISNPGGNLCLHLIGNLNTYIGKELGGTGYIRNREAEFTDRGLPRDVLLQQVEQTAAMLRGVFTGLDESLCGLPYPAKVFDYEMTTGYFLLHLLAHFSYHLGQINYHRRIAESI